LGKNPDRTTKGISVTRKKPAPPPEPRRWRSIQETADYLGVSDKTVRQMIADERIKARRAGERLIRIDLNEVDQDTLQPISEW
jgi:excisionase family DNA binding protein